ncbi:hypothetical protein B0H17DRAFT_1162151 [Mycena rosella]|uniref:Uncharacterized protein n=1 Tax=Mycena rosella TaxID=1033263 RepID=A0AAD7CZ57_MYCRO|nr:hypothetical protein B0H17DRAFT_1162151 [Mycena rosella]
MTPGEPLEFTSHRQPMASFENLVALANYQERLKGSAMLAFNIRASLNLVLALIRIHKVPRDHCLTLIRIAVFGSDSFRFAAMLGTFTALYKLLINALPILIPAMNLRPRVLSSTFKDNEEDFPRPVSYPNSGPVTPLHQRRRSARLSLSAHAQMVLIRKRTRRWHAALAGPISGCLAILWEKHNRRGVIAQQMFVRGLQGTYNSYSGKYDISVPYGAVMVFSIACGQIIYAFTMRPDTLPQSYINWIQGASRMPAESKLNVHAVRAHSLDHASLNTLMARADTTPANLAALATRPSCWSVPLDRFAAVLKWMLSIYSALHFLPSILLRWRLFRADPARVLLRVSLGSASLPRRLPTSCFKNQLHARLGESPLARALLSQRLVDLLISRPSAWVPGFLVGLALLIEEPRWRAELVTYVLPKGLESAWVADTGPRARGTASTWGGMAGIVATHSLGHSRHDGHQWRT